MTQTAEVIEVEVKAYKRRIKRPAYERHSNCACPDLPALEPWMLDWKERIATLYHHNRLRLAQWDGDQPIEQQSEAFYLPWEMSEARRNELARPPPVRRASLDFAPEPP